MTQPPSWRVGWPHLPDCGNTPARGGVRPITKDRLADASLPRKPDEGVTRRHRHQSTRRSVAAEDPREPLENESHFQHVAHRCHRYSDANENQTDGCCADLWEGGGGSSSPSPSLQAGSLSILEPRGGSPVTLAADPQVSEPNRAGEKVTGLIPLPIEWGIPPVVVSGRSHISCTSPSFPSRSGDVSPCRCSRTGASRGVPAWIGIPGRPSARLLGSPFPPSRCSR
jgi:hypothetical protein